MMYELLIKFSVLQMCVWSLDGWAKLAGTFLQIPTGRMLTPLAPTRVQFHQDLIHLLAVHETQIAIYEASKLECLKKVSGAFFSFLILS